MSTDETQVTPDTSEQETEVVEVEETETEEEPEVDIEQIKADAEKAKELAENYKKRAEKAEKKAKEVKPEAQKVELSQLDILAIAKSDVHEEDLERVTKFAQMEGITVKDALGNEDLRAMLERRNEARKVAKASNTDKSTANSGAPSAETMLAKAKKGDMPDPEHLQAFFEAERKSKS